jgi:hypothetical protein
MSQVRVLVGELPKRLILQRFRRAAQSRRVRCLSPSPPFPHLLPPKDAAHTPEYWEHTTFRRRGRSQCSQWSLPTSFRRTACPGAWLCCSRHWTTLAFSRPDEFQDAETNPRSYFGFDPDGSRFPAYGANKLRQCPGWDGDDEISPLCGMHWLAGSCSWCSTCRTRRSNACCACGSMSSSCGN